MPDDRDNLLAAHALNLFESDEERARAERLIADDPEAAAALREIHAALAETAQWEPRAPIRRLDAMPVPPLPSARKMPMMRWPDLVKAAALVAFGFGMGLFARALEPHATTQFAQPAESQKVPAQPPVTAAVALETNRTAPDSNRPAPSAVATVNSSQPDVFSGSAMALMGYAIGKRTDLSGTLEKPKDWLGGFKAPRQIWDTIQDPTASDTDAPGGAPAEGPTT